MTETRNNGKVRVIVDWEDKGVPVFDQASTDDLNLIEDSAFINTKLFYSIAGTATVTEHIAPDDPLPSVIMDDYKNVNPYGVEYLEFQGVGTTIKMGTSMTIPLVPSTDYTLWMWVATEAAFTNDGTHALTVAAYEVESDLTTIVATTNTPFDTGAWQVKAAFHHFTADALADKLNPTLIMISPEPVHGVILGMMLLEGSSEVEPVWNAGTTLGYLDDITDYAMAVDGSIGKTQWETKLFDEGILTIKLNNASKRFSPENRDSDLYTYLQPYRRIWVLISDSNGKYHMLWSGFTQQYALKTGIYNDRQATITCRQGKYSIEAQDDTDLIAASDIDSVDAIQLCFDGGYIIPTGATNAGFTTNQILEDAEAGVGIPIFGIDFVGQADKNYLTTLENISELNGNYTFLSRFGRIIFKTHSTVKDAEPEELPYGLTLETEYMYAPFDLYKSISIKYDVYAFASSGIEMQGQEEVVPAASTDFPFKIYPTYNNKPLIGNVVLDVTSFLPTDYNAIVGSGSANSTPVGHTEGIYTWYSTLSNNSLEDVSSNGLDARISFVSRASSDVWYADETDKDLTVTGIDGKGLPVLTYNNPLITTDDMADAFALQQATRRASIVSWFNRATIANKNAEAVDFIVNHTVGSVIFIQEEQSGDIPKHSIIMGENFRWTPTYLEMTFEIAPTGGEVDIAAFTYHPEELVVDFENLSHSVPEATYLWDFGD